MVVLKTNRPEYRNDIAEEIRLFLGLVDIAETADACPVDLELTVTLYEQDGRFFAEASTANGRSYRTLADLPQQNRLEEKRQEKRALKIAVFRLLRQIYTDISAPWGSLTGIRPTKLFRELTMRENAASAEEQFLHVFDVSPAKTELASRISSVQQPYIQSVRVDRDIDIYIGIPFCRTKCLYCSFASEVIGKQDKLTPYLEVLKTDIAAGAALVRANGLRVRSMYIGGGTPTVLTAEQLHALLSFTLDAYGGYGRELTVEAGRPDTITEEKLRVLNAHGVRRISINPQTMNDDTLVRIGRAHNAAAIEQTYALARDVGFSVINMDLIAGLPGEGVPDFSKTLERVCALRPENITIHSLAIKRSSRLKQHLDAYPLPDAATTERMIQSGAEAASAIGMQPYYMYRQKYMSGNLENTGYALPGDECVYNIDMMEETTSILAHGGCGISKRVFGAENRVERIPNPKEVAVYMAKLPALLDAKTRLFSAACD